MELDDRLPYIPDDVVRVGRPRLEHRVFGSGAASVTVLLGPAGCGKGEVVRSRRDCADTMYYRVGGQRGTFASFVHGLAQSIAAYAPGAAASFPRAWERALQSEVPSAVLARWLCEHLSGIDHHLVIDDLHDAAADLDIAAFIGGVAALRPDAGLTIAARSAGALPIALWMATGRMERPIDETDLRFNRAELATAAGRFGVVLADAEGDALLRATRGSPVALAYALTQLRADPHNRSMATMPSSFTEIADCIFARRTGRERTFLFTAALFPSVDDDLLARSGWDDAPAIRSALGADAAFMWEHLPANGVRFYDRFREYVTRVFQSRDETFRSTIAHRVVESLVLVQRYADALDVATTHRMVDAMCGLLDSHGFEILEAGEVDVISEALMVAADSHGSLGARALALRGYMEARAGHVDTAEAWFRLGLDKAQDEAARVAVALYYARELALRRREDAFEVLEPFADSRTLPRSVLTDVRSSFAQALTAANRLDEAASRTEEALALLEPDSPPALRARVFARAAYVAMECGAFALARERATIAAPLAVGQCLSDVAASTYSVLYNIAYDIDDDASASLHHLARMRDLGAKSGTLRLDMYVMLGRYELYAEAGNEEALLDLDRQLATIDKHDANTEIVETLLPARALQAGWIGDFALAQRLLRPTADRQATPARKALRWAQVALYCAACNDAERAEVAFEKAQAASAECDVRTTHFGLALLILALTDVVAGKLERARQSTAAADDATLGSAPRLHALRDVIDALVGCAENRNGFAAQVDSALAVLWTVSFGGMAKLIEALPYPFAHELGKTATIGRPVPALIGLVDDIDAAIDTLFERLDLVAPLMAEHSRAVSAWCLRLARVMGLSEPEITFVGRCGLIHDIGKTRTPATILTAPRQLNADEWAIMRDHAAEGGRIVAGVPELRALVPIVRAHHERLDGRGYPDGLRANAIPLAARIVSVADSFNAMIGRRPYRLPLAPTDALSELQRHGMTQFDPEIVEAMVRIVLGRLAQAP